MPNELITFVSALTPLGELRASIPLGVLALDMPWLKVFLISIVGNMAPVPVIIAALTYLGDRTERMDNPLGSILRWRANQIRKKLKHLPKKYQILGTTLLVAVPLPFTGAWTASLAVWALGISPIRGMLAIMLGIVIAGIIVMTVILTGASFVGFVVVG